MAISSKAISEVYEIITNMTEEDRKSVSPDGMAFLERGRDKNYKSNIDFSIPLSNQNIDHDTMVLLAAFWAQWMCETEQEKEAFLEDIVQPEYTEGLKFETHDTYAIVSGYTGKSEAVIIPPKYRGLPVTGTDTAAFTACDITSVTVPTSFTEFGVITFFMCPELKDIYYQGTKAQWAAIENNDEVHDCTVHCTDGDI